MTRQRYHRTRLTPFVAVPFACASIVNADDDLKEVAPRNAGHFIRFAKDEPFDTWMFGGNPGPVRKRLEPLIKSRIDELCRRFAFANARRQKLELAAQIDIHRCEVRIAELRRRFDATMKDNNDTGQHDSKSDWVQVRNEIQEFRDTSLRDPFGPNSFLVKTSTKLAADIQRRSNILEVIREIENYVDLQSVQKEAIVDLLSNEPYPTRTNQNLDHVYLKYRFSQLPESALKPIFDKDQWPLVRHLLREFEACRTILIKQRLIARNSEDDVNRPTVSRYRQRNHPADATTPENIPDPIALKKDGE